MEIQLLYELLGGALTGYITNSVAVKMLFKNYGPFGGVILKTRSDFIQNISSLVERDIINAHTLEEELHKKEIRLLLEKMVIELVSTHLPARTHNLLLNDFPGISKSFDNLLGFYKRDLNKYTEGFIKLTLSEIQLDHLFSSEQLAYSGRAFLKRSIDFLRENMILEDLLLSLYRENKDKKIAELYPLKNLPEIIDYLKVKTEELIDIIGEDQERLDNLFYMLYDQLNLPEILNKLTNKIINDLQERLTAKGEMQHLLNEEPEKLLDSLLGYILEFLQNSDKPLVELLGSEFFFRLETELAPAVTTTLEELLPLLTRKGQEIERVLDECIERTFKAESKSFNLKVIFKKIILNSIKKSYTTGISEEEVLEYFFNTTDTTLIGKELAGRIIVFLGGKTPAELISWLEDGGLFDKTNTTSIIKDNLKRKIERIIAKEINLSKLLEESLPETLLKYLKEEILMNREFIENSLFKMKQDNQEYLSSLTIGNLFPENSLYIIADSLMDSLKCNEEKVTGKLVAILQRKTRETLLPDDLITSLSRAINNSIVALLEENKTNFLATKLEVFSNLLKQKQISPQDITEKLTGFLDDNLHLLLEGQISGTIAANLEQVSDRDMQKLIEDFMGRELKPITFFGGILGLLAGGLLFILKTRINLPFNYSLLLSAGIYGLIGYLTNVIAIKMVFRPYQEKRLLGLKLPLTPGVVTREKKRFASALGQFIDEELLNNKKITSLLREKRNTIEQRVVNYLLDKDYQTVKKIALLNRRNIGHSLHHYLLNSARRYTKAFLKNIPHQLSKEPRILIKKLNSFFSGQASTAKASLINQVVALKNTGKTLEDILPQPEKTISLFVKKLSESLIEKVISKIDGLQEVTVLSFMPGGFRKISPLLIQKGLVLFLEDTRDKQLFSDSVNYPTLVENLFKKLKQERGYFKQHFKAKIKANWGFWYSAGQILDLDYTLELFIDEVLDYGLPELLDIYKDDLEGIFNTKLPGIVEDLFRGLSEDLHQPLNNFLEYLLAGKNNEKVWEIIREAVPLEKVKEYTALITSELGYTLRNEKELIAASLAEFSAPIIIKIIRKREISEILKRITDRELTVIIDEIFSNLKQSPLISRITDNYIHNLLEIMQNEGLEAFFDLNLLYTDLQELYQKLNNNQELNENLKQSLTEIVKRLARKLDQVIEANTLEAVSKLIINSIIDSLEDNFPELINQIDIARVTEYEVNRMKAEEIEELFYSFAGKYLTNLERYGWLGSLIGLLNSLLK